MSHFIFDCDDVLLDWVGGFRNYLVLSGFAPKTRTPNDWSMAEWLGISDAEVMRLIERFNSSPAFGELAAYEDALAVVQELKAEGHTLTVLTSCSDDPAIVQRRAQNLTLRFGDAFPRLICLPLGRSKLEWLEVLRPGIWVEDNYKNAMIGHTVGHRTFAMRRSHNRRHEVAGDVITWADTLHEVRDHLQ